MFNVIERLPDGTERVLATGLTLAGVLAYVTPEGSWAIAFVQV